MTPRKRHVRLVVAAALLIACFVVVSCLLWTELGHHYLPRQLSYIGLMAAISVVLVIVWSKDSNQKDDQQEK